MRVFGRTVIGLLLSTSSVFAANSHAERDVEYKVIASGSMSGVHHQMSVVIRDQNEFEMIWRHHSMGVPAPEPIPVVDFESEVVVANFMGFAPTCGHDVSVVDVEEQRNQVQVRTIFSEPRAEIVCLIATQPFEIIKMPRIDGKLVVFKQSVRTR